MPIDYKKYPKNWKTEIVPTVRKRSHGFCEGDAETGYDGEGRCNAPHLEYIARRNDAPHEWVLLAERDEDYSPGHRCILTVAHLDHDEENPTPNIDRLRDLCQRCHLRYDATEKARRVRVKRDHRAGQSTMEFE